MLGDFRKRSHSQDKFGKVRSFKSSRDHCDLQVTSVFDGVSFPLVFGATAKSNMSLFSVTLCLAARPQMWGARWWPFQCCVITSGDNGAQDGREITVEEKILPKDTKLVILWSILETQEVKSRSPSLPFGIVLEELDTTLAIRCCTYFPQWPLEVLDPLIRKSKTFSPDAHWMIRITFERAGLNRTAN